MTARRSYDAIAVAAGQGGKLLAGALVETGYAMAVIANEDRVGGTC